MKPSNKGIDPRMSSNNVQITSRVHEGRNALITGSARSRQTTSDMQPSTGIGEAIARNLASKGANICIIYLSESSDEKAASLAKELSATHSVTATSVRADVRTKEGCATIVAHSQASLPRNPKTGALQIDILVHSAALFHAALLDDVTTDDFHAVYASNVLGPILLTQACRPFLPTDRSGRIVNLSSVGSKVGMAGLTLYGGAKGALEAMTRTWARELAESCTVNAVGVGSTMTDMLAAAPHEAKLAISSFYPVTPLCPAREGDSELQRTFAESYGGRAAYPEEIAGVVGMICSPESGWMTGSLVGASGGMWMSS
ncbi:hypothetical protein PpBr36_06954 [Pyricularia pennisetigena]|uniref:hypothetical protein n=1 Tax=Pyricularia pennisetigena TaxID=1578925 RepID=UPI00114E5AE5|nr:hypothetical protein PpBr36_06954 [Pyricularia pennisetigena]TLS25598.1 hypothetical protein PpBr36_06954 [Pyricularia pennisetigena]